MWLVSGLLAWTGASSFAELGCVLRLSCILVSHPSSHSSSIPLNGGAQAYLAYAYGPLLSYLYAWVYISAVKPGLHSRFPLPSLSLTGPRTGSIAVISLIFGEYLNRLIWHTTRSQVSPDDIPQWAIKLTAVLAVLLVTLICSATQTLGTRASVLFTSVKVGLHRVSPSLAQPSIGSRIGTISFLACADPEISLGRQTSIIILGFVQLARGRESESFQEPLFDGSSRSPSAYSLALYSGLWAFDGFDQANFVAGEVKNSAKNIPRAIHCSMAMVLVSQTRLHRCEITKIPQALFLLTNIAYLVVLDKDTVGLSNTVALDFGRALFGPVGGLVFALMVAISCFGALNGDMPFAGRSNTALLNLG